MLVLFENTSILKQKNAEPAIQDCVFQNMLCAFCVLQCVEVKPDWAKGYSRLGAAYYGLEEWEDAVKAYEDGEQMAYSSSTSLWCSTRATAAAGAIGPKDREFA